jgi:hypothetical protein
VVRQHPGPVIAPGDTSAQFARSIERLQTNWIDTSNGTVDYREQAALLREIAAFLPEGDFRSFAHDNADRLRVRYLPRNRTLNAQATKPLLCQNGPENRVR